MNEFWNLDPIYKGFDDPAFDADLERLKNLITTAEGFMEQLQQAEPLAALKEGIRLEEEMSDLAGKLAQYAILRQNANSKDSEAGSCVGRVMAQYSRLAAPMAAFQDWASKLPDLMELVRSDESLKDYEFLFANMADSSRYLLPDRGEEIMAKMQLTGGSAWSELHTYLTSTVPVEYNGETTTLSAIRNKAHDADPAVRKAAFEAEIACYDRIKDSIAYALNSIKLETLNECALRGYASPLERELKNAHLKKETLDAMFAAMDEYLPKFWQYLKMKAKVLGHEKGLPWYDMLAPMGTSHTKFTPESARDFLVELFNQFNPQEGDMIAQAFDEAWIDFFPREGKTGGAFCAGVDCLGESRILTNFCGTFSDVVTLAHELGHAYHNLCVREHRSLNKDYSMPVAETASTFNECVVMAAAIEKAADRDEKIALIESQLQDACQIICDIYSRYRFESMVFEKRPEEFMDADALCQLMLEAQKQCYGDGLDHDQLHPYMWVCKGHYYGPTFYNFPYAFGGLFARGLYAKYEQEGEAFVPKYKKLLYTTTVATAEDTALVAGIDLTDKDFWRAALQTIADQIDLLCGLLEA